MVRTMDEWARHPQAAAIASLPLMEIVKIGESPPEPLPEGDRPLSGIRVLDLTRVLAGPFATMLLGDAGAEIVKVEPPRGDETRQWGPPWPGGESAYFVSINRDKRRIGLDMRFVVMIVMFGFGAFRHFMTVVMAMIMIRMPGHAVQLPDGADAARQIRDLKTNAPRPMVEALHVDRVASNRADSDCAFRRRCPQLEHRPRRKRPCRAREDDAGHDRHGC